MFFFISDRWKTVSVQANYRFPIRSGWWSQSLGSRENPEVHRRGGFRSGTQLFLLRG